MRELETFGILRAEQEIEVVLDALAGTKPLRPRYCETYQARPSPRGNSAVPQLQQELDQLKAAKRSLPALIQQLAILERAQANQLGATTISMPAPAQTPNEP